MARPCVPLLCLALALWLPASPLAAVSASADVKVTVRLVELIQKVRRANRSRSSTHQMRKRTDPPCAQKQYDPFVKELSKEGMDVNQVWSRSFYLPLT